MAPCYESRKRLPPDTCCPPVVNRLAAVSEHCCSRPLFFPTRGNQMENTKRNPNQSGGGPLKSLLEASTTTSNNDATPASKSLSQRHAGTIPRFLIVKRKEGDFCKVSSFLIEKVIQETVGTLKSARKIREGLRIETNNMNQSKKLLGLKKFGNYEIEVTPHASLNYTKGVVTDLLIVQLLKLQQI